MNGSNGASSIALGQFLFDRSQSLTQLGYVLEALNIGSYRVDTRFELVPCRTKTLIHALLEPVYARR